MVFQIIEYKFYVFIKKLMIIFEIFSDSTLKFCNNLLKTDFYFLGFLEDGRVGLVPSNFLKEIFEENEEMKPT